MLQLHESNKPPFSGRVREEERKILRWPFITVRIHHYVLQLPRQLHSTHERSSSHTLLPAPQTFVDPNGCGASGSLCIIPDAFSTVYRNSPPHFFLWFLTLRRVQKSWNIQNSIQPLIDQIHPNDHVCHTSFFFTLLASCPRTFSRFS